MGNINTGKAKVFIIAVLNVLITIIGKGNLIAIILMAVISLFLFKGTKWVKYLFIVICCLHTITALLSIISFSVGIGWKLFYLLNAVYRISSIVMLFADKDIKEFFNSKKFNSQA